MKKSKTATRNLIISLAMCAGFMGVYLAAHHAKTQRKQVTINASNHGARLILIREAMRR